MEATSHPIPDLIIVRNGLCLVQMLINIMLSKTHGGVCRPDVVQYQLMGGEKMLQEFCFVNGSTSKPDPGV